MSSDASNPEVPRRRALKASIGALCSEAGFGAASEGALETLTEMLQSYLTELGRSTRAYSELSGRTDPMLGDVIMALIDMGFSVQSLPAYAKRTNKMMIQPPALSIQTPTPKALQAGVKKSHPDHIPHYLPPFPDPHAYIRTPTFKEPVSEYQVVREKAATYKRDVERALTRFIAKTGLTESLFSDDVNAYPLIACKPKPLPYLEALLPKDQDLDSLEDLDKESKQDSKAAKDSSKPASMSALVEQSQQQVGAPDTPGADMLDSEGQIDNPYLRPIKMPKFPTGKSKKSSKSSLW